MVRVVQRAAEADWSPDRAAVDGTADALLGWLHEYESLLKKAGLIERGEAHRIVAAGTHAAELIELVAVEGFSGLTRAQEQYLIRSSGQAEVHIGLTFDPDVPATLAAATTAERLGGTGVVTTLPSRPTDEGPPELVRIERAFGEGVLHGEVPNSASAVRHCSACRAPRPGSITSPGSRRP